MTDNVNTPQHYKQDNPDYEPIKIIEYFDFPFHLANVFKYMVRFRKKDGIQDLKKARWYIDRYIKKQEEDVANNKS